MKFNRNNPWLVGIIGGAIGAVLAGIMLYYLFDYRNYKHSISIIKSSIYSADNRKRGQVYV